jgi:hypothetical protein
MNVLLPVIHSLKIEIRIICCTAKNVPFPLRHCRETNSFTILNLIVEWNITWGCMPIFMVLVTSEWQKISFPACKAGTLKMAGDTIRIVYFWAFDQRSILYFGKIVRRFGQVTCKFTTRDWLDTTIVSVSAHICRSIFVATCNIWNEFSNQDAHVRNP